MRKLLLFILLITISSAQDLDTLLEEYRNESELSKKTKNESAGNLIVYTRDDLERMQVESLKDILKSLRLFAYLENRLAQTDLLNSDPITYNSKSIRIYLNEHELLTAVTGSGLILFGDIEMDFIDHIEIYEGFPSFEFGIEPATVVIRLYSKTPKHDEGGRVKFRAGSNGSHKENIYYAHHEKDLSYFFYANKTTNKLDHYTHDQQSVQRDKTTTRFFASLSKENHKIELHAMKVNGDAFLGSFVGATPNDTAIQTSFLNITSSSTFLQDTLMFNMSYIQSKNKLNYNYDQNTLFLSGLGYVTSFDQTLTGEDFTTSLDKKWEIANHSITTGIQYRYKTFDLSDIKFNHQAPLIDQTYDVENIYSFYLEDSISLNEKHLIIASIMSQFYDRNKNVKDINTQQIRLGYIYTNKQWVSKTFLSSQEFSPEPYMTISPAYGNSNLNADVYTSIFQEFTYKYERTSTKLVLSYGTNENYPVYDINTHKMENHTGLIHGSSAAVEWAMSFREKDKINLQVNYFRVEDAYNNGEYGNWYNYVARMLNSVGKYDIFNELVINQGYDFGKTPTGYNYSLGVKYNYNKDLHINFKAENIFDSGLTHNYWIDPTTNNSIRVPTIERSVFFGMEYLF